MRKMIAIIYLLAGFTSLYPAEKAWIRINQLGYPPEALKVAVLGAQELLEVREFELVEVLSEAVVLRSKDIRHYSAYASFKAVYRLNFSDFRIPGRYFLRVGDIRSPQFTIAADVYDGAADFLLNYMRQQRCGYNPFLRDSCHTRDGFIVDFPERDSTFIDVTGGWHDASDYLQYATTSANAVYQMLFAYQENPHAFGDAYQANGDPGANGIPDILDEARWGLDWLDKLNPEPGVMFHQIADDRDHRKFTLPTRDSIDYGYGKGRERPVYHVTGKAQGLAKYKNRSTGVSSTAAKFASAFAMGSELLRAYDPAFCEKIARKARDAYAYAKSDLGVSQTASNVSPYFYEEDNYVDDMELAAAALFQQEDDPALLKEAAYWGNLEPVTPWMIADTARHYQWYPFFNVGHYQVARDGDSLTARKFIRFMRLGLEQVYRRAEANGFLMGVPFIWCSNNLVAATLTQAQLYRRLSGDERFDEMEAALRDWLFGCNPWGTSMIVGLPAEGDSPVDPHSALTAVFNLKIDGGLVDGPVYTSIFKRLIGIRIVNGDEYAQFQSDLCVYHDDYGDYSTNEPTMDGTACLTYYLSALDSRNVPGRSEHYQRHLGAIVRGDTSRKVIHLVFTGGDYYDGGEIIRKTLKRRGIKAQFFFTGDFYRRRATRSLIKGLIADGHYLGAHSDQHLLYAPWENRDSLLISKDEFIRDLQANYREMARFGISKEDAPLFLPPYEWYNQTISDWTRELGLTLINFTPGTRSNADYTTPDMGARYVDSQTIFRSIVDHEASAPGGLNGFILLLHIGTHPDRGDKFYQRLDELIEVLQQRGYRFELLNSKSLRSKQ